MTLNCVFYTIYPPPPYWRVSCHCRENQWMRTASSEWRCAEQSVTISAAGWCDVTSSLTGPCSWHLSTFMSAAKIATMGSALGWELKVQLPLFTSPLLHPLTAPSCHIVRLKVQTSPSDSRPTWKHLCGIMAASSDPVAALSSSRTCVDKALQMTIGWWRPPQRRSQTSEYTEHTAHCIKIEIVLSKSKSMHNP